MYDPCEYCQYSSKAMDMEGHYYYECELDDDPDNHPSAECCSKGGNDGLYEGNEEN